MATSNSKTTTRKQSLSDVFEAMKGDFYALQDIAENYHKCPFTDITMADVIENLSALTEKKLDSAAQLFSGKSPQGYRQTIGLAKHQLDRLREFTYDMRVRHAEENELPAWAKRSSLLFCVSEMGEWISEAMRSARLNDNGADFDIASRVTARRVRARRVRPVLEVAYG